MKLVEFSIDNHIQKFEIYKERKTVSPLCLSPTFPLFHSPGILMTPISKHMEANSKWKKETTGLEHDRHSSFSSASSSLLPLPSPQSTHTSSKQTKQSPSWAFYFSVSFTDGPIVVVNLTSLQLHHRNKLTAHLLSLYISLSSSYLLSLHTSSMNREETTQNQEPTSTIKSNPQNSPQKTNLASKKMVGLAKKTRPRSSRTQRISIKNNDQEHEHDKVEVQQKIVALQRIVPGGEELGVDKLFEETACYIKSLQNQVMAMRALTSLFEGLEREKTMFGGWRWNEIFSKPFFFVFYNVFFLSVIDRDIFSSSFGYINIFYHLISLSFSSYLT